MWQKSHCLSQEGRDVSAPKTIVSVTPLRVEADSRAFKIAASLARFGYHSILVEQEKSDLNRPNLPFDLRSMGNPLRTRNVRSVGDSEQLFNNAPEASIAKVRTILKNANSRLPKHARRLLRPLAKPPVFLTTFLITFLWRSVVVPLSYIPQASAYYMHGHTLFPAVYLLSKKYRVPFIYDAHDFYSGFNSPKEWRSLPFEKRWPVIFFRYLESRLIKSAAAIVTVSDGIAQLMERAFGCSPVVVRNCHDARLDQEPPKSLRQFLDLSSSEFLVVAVGNAKEGMAVQEALVSMLELPDNVHFAFLGRFYETYLDRIRSMGLQKRVHLVPPLKPYEVVPFIKSADASIILYYPKSIDYQKSLPNRFFQSIAAGLPLFYPQLPEIRRIAEKYRIGIPIDPQVPRSMSTAIIKLMNDVQLMATLRRNVRAASKSLGWQEEEAVLHRLIERAVR